MSWSLADLAARTGLSRAYLSALERGRSKRPGAETIRRLEGALGSLTSNAALPADAPPGLAALAMEHHLTDEDVALFSALKVRGRQPQSRERWSFIYQALLASEAMDDSTYDRRTAPRDASE